LDILQLAEDYYYYTFAVVFAIGLLQGSILARGIRKKFPKLKKYAKGVSIILLILFSINAAGNILKFAEPPKVELTEFIIPETPESAFLLLIDVLGLNAGVIAVTGIFLSITLILLFRFADLNRISRYFIFTISVIVFIIAMLGRFTDYVPNTFQIILYVMYQFGMTLGIFTIMRRREKNLLDDMK
tara:strand:- start:1730 stop:2287 length:558 start_codon:yes stop_codon:yes gene_type:complete